METVTLNVDGMSCGGCVASVMRVLKATPGVGDAVVELAAKRATVTFDPARTSAAALKAAIDGAGYAASDAAN
jgi:copper chaperone